MQESANVKQNQDTSLSYRILLARGWTDEAARQFLDGPDVPPAPPEELLGMAEAVSLVSRLAGSGARVLVHGDYDVDGLCSTTILCDFLELLGLEVTNYVPDRLNEGYGLAAGGVQAALEQGADLLVTCDCGIQSFEEVATLKAAGMAVIVTDHHVAQNELPTANAVINPNRQDQELAFKQLCGAVVALKLCWGLNRQLAGQTLRGAVLAEDAWQAGIPYAALATIADMMPLLDENRTLVRLGLEMMRQGKMSPGLAALLEACGVEQAGVTSEALSYRVSPKLNAAGRLGRADVGLSLLRAGTQEARQLAAALLNLNEERQAIGKAMNQSALEQIRLNPVWIEDQVLVLNVPDGHLGLSGIVAATLAEQFGCPAIVFVPAPVLPGDAAEPTLRGSGRSWGGVNILDLCEPVRARCLSLGGHPQACGLEIRVADFEWVQNELRQAARSLRLDAYASVRQPDLELSLEEVTLANLQDLQRLEPCGEENPRPLLRFPDIALEERRWVGQDSRHLRLSWHGPQLEDGEVNGIAFGVRELQDQLDAPDTHWTIDCYLSLNTFRGRESAELSIQRLQPGAGLRVDEPWDGLERVYHLFPEWTVSELAAVAGRDEEELRLTRPMLADTYRLLRERLADGPKRERIFGICTALQEGYKINSNPFQLRRVLDIYREAGLLARRFIGDGTALLGLVPVQERTDLYGTATWLRISGTGWVSDRTKT